MERGESRHGRDDRCVRGPRGMSGPRGMHVRRSLSEAPRSVARGGIRFAILELLKEKPRHGYDIIRAMEEASGGLYSPSPGAIYPTLQALEDQDLISASTEDGKKVYAVTEAGTTFLAEHKDKADAHRERWRAQWGESGRGLPRDALRVIHDSFDTVGRAIRDSAGDAAKLEEISELLKETAGKVDDIAGRQPE